MPNFQSYATLMYVFLNHTMKLVKGGREMIHRDLCNPANTKNYSPLRMQFHFVLSRYVCWDGFIPLTRQELAELLSCDIQSIQKFIKKGVREGVLSIEGNRLYLLKKVDEYMDGYVKHYPFLESPEFRSLSAHAQRFILYTLWTGVHTGRPLKRAISALYHSTHERNGVLNLYSKAPVYPVLEEAKTFLRLEIVQQKGKEMVRVTGLQEPFASQLALDNHGERKLLEDILEANYCEEIVSSVSREEILKLKKHYVRTLGSVGMEMFSHALRKLLTLHKLYELDLRKEVGLYFNSILRDLEEKILPTIQKRIVYVKQAIKQTKHHFLHAASQWVPRFESELNKLVQASKTLKSRKERGNTPDPSNESKPVLNTFVFYNWLEQD